MVIKSEERSKVHKKKGAALGWKNDSEFSRHNVVPVTIEQICFQNAKSVGGLLSCPV